MELHFYGYLHNIMTNIHHLLLSPSNKYLYLLELVYAPVVSPSKAVRYGKNCDERKKYEKIILKNVSKIIEEK